MLSFVSFFSAQMITYSVCVTYQNEMQRGLLEPLNPGEIIQARSPARCTLSPLKVIKFPEERRKEMQSHLFCNDAGVSYCLVYN